jgi:hypothetical protein
MMDIHGQIVVIIDKAEPTKVIASGRAILIDEAKDLFEIRTQNGELFFLEEFEVDESGRSVCWRYSYDSLSKSYHRLWGKEYFVGGWIPDRLSKNSSE